jgi:hypothetical protein
MNLHKTLSVEKWSAFSKGQQILMIANEINRAKNSLTRNKPEDAKSCYERALDLTDITINDTKWKNDLKELLRCREFIGMLFCETNLELNEILYKTLILLNPESYNLLHA